MNHKILTCLILLLSTICSFASFDAYAQRGEKSVGLRAGFTSRNTTATAGLYFSYRFNRHFRIAPKIDYAFQHNSTDAFAINFDTEYPFALGSAGRANFYPIAGLNFSTYSTHFTIENDDESLDSSHRTNHLGINLGAGLEYFATPTLRLAFESKCLLLKQYTGAWLTLSIGYRF